VKQFGDATPGGMTGVTLHSHVRERETPPSALHHRGGSDPESSVRGTPEVAGELRGRETLAQVQRERVSEIETQRERGRETVRDRDRKREEEAEREMNASAGGCSLSEANTAPYSEIYYTDALQLLVSSIFDAISVDVACRALALHPKPAFCARFMNTVLKPFPERGGAEGDARAVLFLFCTWGTSLIRNCPPS
jgi:hypothetical protein